MSQVVVRVEIKGSLENGALRDFSEHMVKAMKKAARDYAETHRTVSVTPRDAYEFKSTEDVRPFLGDDRFTSAGVAHRVTVDLHAALNVG